MLQTTYQRFYAQLIHPDPRQQFWAVLALLLISGLVIGLVIGVAGPTIAMALTVGALGAWLVLRSPMWGLVGIIAISMLLPFATLPFKLGFTPSFLDLAIFATFGVWVLKYVLGDETRLNTTSIGLVVFLFLIMAAFTFAMGLRHARPTSNNVRQFAEMVLSITLFFVTVNVVRQRAQLLFISRVFMFCGAVAAAIGVVFYVIPQEATVWVLDRLVRVGYPGGFGALRFVNDDPENLMRAIGTSIDPNVYGGLLILVGLFTLPQLFAKSPIISRKWAAIMVGLEVVALYMTISRGSMVGFAIGLAAIGVFRYRKLLALGLVAGLLFLVLPITQDYLQHLMAGFALQDRATQMRLGEYRDALTLISRYPVFGVGFTGAPEIDLYIGVSSLYLLMAENMGLVGVGIFLLTMLLFVNALVRSLRQPQLDSVYESLLLGVFGAMVALLAAGWLDHYLFNLTYPHMTSLLWIFVGLGMVTVGLAEEREEPAERSAELPAAMSAQ